MTGRGDVALVVTNGCSFTFGTGLHDPATTVWGRRVADHFGAGFVNLATGGGSNRRLVRTTVERLARIVEEARVPPERVVFLGMWAELARTEVYDTTREDEGFRPDFPDACWHRIGPWSIERGYVPAIHYYRYLQDDQGDAVEWLLGHTLLESYLVRCGVVHGFIWVTDLLDETRVIEGLPYLDLIDERRILGGWEAAAAQSFEVVTRNMPWRRGHPAEEAHRHYAEAYVVPFVEKLLSER